MDRLKTNIHIRRWYLIFGGGKERDQIPPNYNLSFIFRAFLYFPYTVLFPKPKLLMWNIFLTVLI